MLRAWLVHQTTCKQLASSKQCLSTAVARGHGALAEGGVPAGLLLLERLEPTLSTLLWFCQASELRWGASTEPSHWCWQSFYLTAKPSPSTCLYTTAWLCWQRTSSRSRPCLLASCVKALPEGPARSVLQQRPLLPGSTALLVSDANLVSVAITSQVL